MRIAETLDPDHRTRTEWGKVSDIRPELYIRHNPVNESSDKIISFFAAVLAVAKVSWEKLKTDEKRWTKNSFIRSCPYVPTRCCHSMASYFLFRARTDFFAVSGVRFSARDETKSWGIDFSGGWKNRHIFYGHPVVGANKEGELKTSQQKPSEEKNFLMARLSKNTFPASR